MDNLEGEIDFADLRLVEKDTVLLDNTILFNFDSDPRGLYFVPPKGMPPNETKHTVKGVVERSMRETRMRRGVGVGALHQWVDLAVHVKIRVECSF